MTFVKGQSGNPGGRPKSVEGQVLRDLARKYTQEAIDTLVEICTDDNAPQAARVAAGNSILDRGWGKPTQPISGDDSMPAIAWGQAPDAVVAWVAAQSEDAATAH